MSPTTQDGTAMTYAAGETVEVHAFGHWYVGTVTKVGRTRVHVRYTSGTGTTRVKACPLALVRRTWRVA